jgi:MFS family permease
MTEDINSLNGTPSRIEIIAPFKAAIEWMKGMLFRPFDLARWLTIAFAAFIAGGWGSGFNPRWNRWHGGDWNYRFSRHGEFSDWTVPGWLIVLVVLGVLAALALVLLWAWVTARGRFIFTDCVVRNRAAIAEPWREYRREGNSFFLFSLVVGFGMMLTVMVLVLGAWVPFQMFFGDVDELTAGGVVLIVIVVLLVVLWALVALFLAVVTHFMIPVMYRRRCSARVAFLDVAKLIFQNPGPFILFVLFGIALAIGVAIAGTIVTCLTCCVGGFPYISTVLLLPAIVWVAAYRLLFIRQFGDEYDVWSGIAPPAAEVSVPPTAPEE